MPGTINISMKVAAPQPVAIELLLQAGPVINMLLTKQAAPSVNIELGNIGPKGDAGPPGGNYTHTQASAASIWTVAHNLGYKPGGIWVQDSGGSDWYGTVTHIDDNNLTINFGNASFGGKAYLS